MIFIDIEELIAQGSGVSRTYAFAPSNQRAATFGPSPEVDRTYFTRHIPDSWQGKNILVYLLCSHRTGALTGTGSPPDDQVRLEIGWETLADAVAYVDLGVRNDATAPHESDVNQQLGTTQEAVLWVLGATIATSGSDRFLHVRVTRDGADALDGLSGALQVSGAVLLGG
jgi:hypothetical protein